MPTARAIIVDPAGNLTLQAHRAARSRWMDRAARIGFVARGVVHAIIGVLALQLVFGEGGALLGPEDTPDQ